MCARVCVQVGRLCMFVFEEVIRLQKSTEYFPKELTTKSDSFKES